MRAYAPSRSLSCAKRMPSSVDSTTCCSASSATPSSASPSLSPHIAMSCVSDAPRPGADIASAVPGGRGGGPIEPAGDEIADRAGESEARVGLVLLHGDLPPAALAEQPPPAPAARQAFSHADR